MTNHTAATPWWKDSPAPWQCVNCGDQFGCLCHLEGHGLCASASCSRLCESCFADAPDHLDQVEEFRAEMKVLLGPDAPENVPTTKGETP